MPQRSTGWLVFTVALLAQPTARADRIDDFIDAEMRRQRIPGVSFAIIDRGRVIKAAGRGLADRTRRIEAGADTAYWIGSISKPVIATGVMQLVERKRLRLDEPIATHLHGTPTHWGGITVRHLLSHTSGLVREAPGLDRSRVQADADVIRSAYQLPLQSPPGAKWAYSNLGYTILAEIISVVTGRPWADHLREAIFGPAGMSATTTTARRTTQSKRAVGYTDNDRLDEAVLEGALRPGGAFLSTVEDLAKWDAALQDGRLLSDASRDEMWTPVTLTDGSTWPYGLGWELDPLAARRRAHHGGEISGFLSEFTRLIDEQLTIVVLINLDDADVESIVRGIVSRYAPNR